MRIIDSIESDVRSYVRDYPVIFDRAEGSHIWDEQGNEYLDFFAGAGVMNYGHNNPLVTEALIEYLKSNGIVHSLDKATVAKKNFLQTFYDNILSPRNMDYKVQFTGPTGTNSVETALKLARMVKQRSNIIAFTNGYHGLTMGALAITGNYFYRDKSYGSRSNVDHMPFDGFMGEGVNTIDYFRKLLENSGSGIDLPAAVILETIQAEGGVNVASVEWLRELEQLCRDFDILLIVDDIQVGNGRTGNFFSFEESGINPDMICLSKSIGGGLPMALLLMKPELDQWQPGEHTGTFRGNNLAFVASTQLINNYWSNDDLTKAVEHKSKIISTRLNEIAKEFPEYEIKVRGFGLIWGIEIPRKGFVGEVLSLAFEKGLIVENCGTEGHVLKLLPPLTTSDEDIEKGLDIIHESIRTLVKEKETMLTEGF